MKNWKRLQPSIKLQPGIQRDAKVIQRIKDKHVKNWFHHLTTAEKIAFFGRRISRHIKELYYENNEENL